MVQPEDCAPEVFDYIILGTGLTETVLSCILSKNGNTKILHLDKNSSYGSEFATLQYKQMESYFGVSADKANTALHPKDREFNIDLTPKLLLQDSRMKEFFLDHQIDDMVTFTSIKGSYMFAKNLHSIPTSETESLKSSVLPLFEKYKAIKFFWHVRNYFNNKGIATKSTMREEFDSFGLSKESMDFIGHAIALNLNDDYLDKPPQATYERIVKYISSIISYDNSKSPYIYPLYGLSEICQSFVRKSALNGTLFMLKADIKKIDQNKIFLVDPNGDPHFYIGKKIIADPRYYETSRATKEIIRCIAIIKKEPLDSRNILFLRSYLNRVNDIFCVILGSEQYSCPEEYEVAIISTVKETADPQQEIEPVLKKFNVLAHFLEVRKLLENNDTETVIFTKNVDESPSMDNIYDDIEDVLKKVQ